MPLSLKDSALYGTALRAAFEHTSEGDFDMVACWGKGSQTVYGYNRLKRPARRRRDEYPEMAGIHAELDLWRYNNRVSTKKSDLSGGTVAIAGKKPKTMTTMTTTRPCAYCVALLHELGVSTVVFLQDGKLFKCRVATLLGTTYSPHQ